MNADKLKDSFIIAIFICIVLMIISGILIVIVNNKIYGDDKSKLITGEDAYKKAVMGVFYPLDWLLASFILTSVISYHFK